MNDDEYLTYEQVRDRYGFEENQLNKFLGRHKVKRYVKAVDIERAIEDSPGRGRWGPRTAGERR